MPSVSRQSPNQQSRSPAEEGSMLARVVKARELTNSYIKMVVYGQNRVGKTTLACSFPKPLLLIAVEANQTGGANSVKKIEGVEVVTCSNTLYEKEKKVSVAEQVRRLIRELQGDTYYKTHVLDSITALQEWVLVEIKNWDEPQLQNAFDTRGDKGVDASDYRIRSEELRKLLWPLLLLPVNTVCTAKEKDHNPPKEEKFTAAGKQIPDMRPRFLRGMQQESFIAPEVGGATVGWIQDICDYVGRVYYAKEVIREKGNDVEVNGQKISVGGGERETGKYVRCLRTLFHPNYAAGFRSSNAVPEYIEIPDGVNGYERIKQVIDGTYQVKE